MAYTALAFYLRLGMYLTIVPFKVNRNSKSESYSCIMHRKIFLIPCAIMQVTSILAMITYDWAGVYDQNTIRKLVYSLFNVHATCGMITLWTRSKQFEIALNAIQEFQACAEQIGIVMPSQKRVSC